MTVEKENAIPTASGRNFAKTGGVLEAVKLRLKDKSILRETKINGLNKTGMKTLSMYGNINAGKLPQPENCPNLIEVMSCEGGCIAGPCVITDYKKAEVQLAQYVKSGAADK